MEYTFVIHKAEEGGYWVEVPALPGCYSQGESMDEVLSNVREAIAAYIAALEEDGQEVPTEDSILVGRVGVASS